MDAIEIARAQAIAYVWGRQDESGKGAKDTAWSAEFGDAFAARREAYDAPSNGVGMMPNIQSAYDEYRKTGKIS